MLLAMVCALGLSVLAIQVAQANDMRSRAQIAADAAAIAAVTPLRDAALSRALNGDLPGSAGLWTVEPNENAPNPIYNRKAADYAKRNGAQLAGKVRPSGILGETMKASVQTEDCFLKDEKELTAKDREDLANNRNICTDRGGKTGISKGRGTATAIAELRLPECRYEGQVAGVGGEGGSPARMRCDRVIVWRANGGGVPRERALRLFKVRLVAKEAAEKYTGMPDSGLPSGPYVEGECRKDGPKPDKSVPFGERIVLWAKCWLGTPYSWGGGGPRGPSTGICCSPGGYSGTNTVGFDCSGLTQYAVYQASGGKILLPRTTYYQVNFGVRLHSVSQLRPGDLIFPNPGHVAVYAGGGMMVEAPSTGLRVRVAPIEGRGFYAGVHVPPPAGDR
ncbi:NlpC/P60 family protein [Actinomadura viridis]|uniref:Cell wall-associated NlpC family hydrolase n=1 Tax=Actinomadura viridis TaxID=58110 RepID=A0A931GHB0_9ACTN|nr:cell wall-associated NlpC family hydrolase [Actinomadura viridis]